MTEDAIINQSYSAQRSEPTLESTEASTLYNIATHNPFAEKESASDFFDGGDRTTQLDEAIHLCQFGNNVVLVTGDTGIGKTFFVEQACFELSETASCCFISATEDLSSEAIAKEVSTELSMPFATHQTIEQLMFMLEDANALEDIARFIIVVDDIHLLAEDIIISLLRLSQISQNTFHLLASGLPYTFNILENIELSEGLVKNIHLEPYTTEDTYRYLNFKMKASGLDDDNFFDVKTALQIHRSSAGYPQKINQLAEEHILSQEQDIIEDEPSSSGLPLWHMIGLVFLIFALIMAFFYGDSGSDNATEQAIPLALGDQAPNINNETIIPTDNNAVENSTSLFNPITEIQTTGEESSNFTSGDNTLAEATPAPAPAPINNEASTLISPPESEATTETEVVDSSAVILDENQVADTITSSATADAAPDVTNTSEILVEENTPTPTTAIATSVAEAESPTTEPAEVEQTRYSPDEEAVLAWPESHSTIQIIGALDKASVERFVEAQANKDLLRLVTINRDNKPWHIVLADHYTDNTQARAAIQQLPQNQVNASPWIRKVSDLKQGIRDFPR